MGQGSRLTAAILAVFLSLALGGCRRAQPARVEGKINVTSVTFPSYDFVRVIAGDMVNLVMLLPPGTESHSFEPSPRDIITINGSDLFIYPGGENSKWVDRILQSLDASSTDRMTILRLMDMVEVVEEEIVEGMEHEDDDHDDDDHSPVLDEHVWTSPRNAKVIVASITEALCELDGGNADFFRRNAAAYLASLDELDASFRAVVDGARRKTVIFGDRFPFRYLTDAYGLSYFAAFPGCSTDTEPSAATVAFLINKVRSEQVPVIFHIELSNEKMADTISEAAGVKKLLLHSAHNVTRRDFESGANYLDIQRANVENLREALW